MPATEEEGSRASGIQTLHIARRLVAAAREWHRDSSPWDPGVCGDDVTCVVLIARVADLA